MHWVSLSTGFLLSGALQGVTRDDLISAKDGSVQEQDQADTPHIVRLDEAEAAQDESAEVEAARRAERERRAAKAEVCCSYHTCVVWGLPRVLNDAALSPISLAKIKGRHR